MPEPLDICDDLHGVVHLDEHQAAIIDSPWFQRLRRIRQLGLAHMVFPGAEHTRFAHSLGVFHLALRIADRLGDSVISKEERRELGAAALLHDIGHFPFSHTLERVYKDLGAEAERDKANLPTETAEPEAATGPARSARDGAAFHEEFGKRVIEDTTGDGGITRILKENELEPARVALIVVGDHENLLLNQILKSDLDVDQLDYLLRDAKATGSTYGHYDLGYLVECLDVAYLEETPVLCVSMQGLHALEHYVLAKYFYFMCILYQKTRCVIEALLQAVSRELIAAGRLPSWHDLNTGYSHAAFCDFDDVAVWDTLRRTLGDESVGAELRAAIAMLMRRELPKVDSEAHVTVKEGEELPESFRAGVADGEWNPIVRGAAQAASRQKFTVLERALRNLSGSPEALKEVLLSDPRPIRLLVKPPYHVPQGIPSMPARDKGGSAVDIVLLESLHGSVVANLAGQTTHIARVYRPR